MNHTPTPWVIGARGGIEGESVTICEAGKYAPIALAVRNRPYTGDVMANAQFIVRAVNAHKALVEACKAAWKFLYMQPTARSLQQQMEVHKILEAAIDKAEETP